MDIITAFKLHKKHFGAEETYKLIGKVDQVFIDNRVNGIKRRDHDAREMLRISNNHLISEIGHKSECSERIFRRSGLNSLTWFFPAGFKAALTDALVSKFRNNLPIGKIRDDVFAIDLGL